MQIQENGTNIHKIDHWTLKTYRLYMNELKKYIRTTVTTLKITVATVTLSKI